MGVGGENEGLSDFLRGVASFLKGFEVGALSFLIFNKESPRDQKA